MKLIDYLLTKKKMKKIKTKKCSILLELPFDIIAEILHGVPYKQLLLMKAISKQFQIIVSKYIEDYLYFVDPKQKPKNKYGYTHVGSERKIFENFVGKSGCVWLVTNSVQNNSEYIYASTSNNSGNHGGCVNMRDGTVESLTGFWKSNSDDLYHDTGIDIRNNYQSFCVVSRYKDDYKKRKNYYILRDILYKDEEYKLGRYERAGNIADNLSKKYQHSVYLYDSPGWSLFFINKIVF